MKYAPQVIELLAAYPGRGFRMADIVRHVSRGRGLSPIERNAVRQALLRVLSHLVASGQVEREESAVNSCRYAWCRKVRHGVLEKCDANCDNTCGNLRP